MPEAGVAYAAGYLSTSKAFCTDQTIFCRSEDLDVLNQINAVFDGAGVIAPMDDETWALSITDQAAVQKFYAATEGLLFR